MRDATFIAEIDATNIKLEDGGQSATIEFSSDDSDLFIRLMSWNEGKKHDDLRRLIGRRIRITIEDAADAV